ncbi:MAG TPA: transporter substrate-binding domain-containing protein [Gaiellaceae bacterium]
MKHLTGAVLVAAVVASLTFAALGTASTSGKSGAKSTAAAAKLPALPSYVKARHKWVIGVKCDYVPFGYYDVQGNHRGYDVAIARRFATLAFGAPRKVKLVCVTTPSRIPTLQSSQVDMIISTLTWTAARTQVIDFSAPYYNATGRLLVPNNSSINSLQNLSGKTVVTTRGAIYATWIRNCFKSTNLLEVDGTAAAVLAVKEGRADTFMFDDALILGVAAQDPTLKLTNDKFLNVPWGIGLRKGDTAAVKWVNAAINYMRKRGEFAEILKANAPKKYWSTFVPNAPGPKTTFKYPVGQDPSAVCTS